MKKYLLSLVLASIALLGANFAHAAVSVDAFSSGSYSINVTSSVVEFSAGGYYSDPWLYLVDPSSTAVRAGTITQTDSPSTFWAQTSPDANGIEAICWGSYTGTNVCTIGGSAPIYFKISSDNNHLYFDDSYSDLESFSVATSTAPSIYFSIPTGGTNPNFSRWQINGSDMPTAGTIFRVDVVYSQLGGETTYDDFNIANSYFSPEAFLIPKTFSFATGSSWTAQAFLFSTGTTDDNLGVTDPAAAIASTSVIFFSIGSGAGSSTPPIVSVCPSAPPIFQITGSLPYFIINNPIPSIESGGCNILLLAFRMNDAQSADINTRYSNAAAVISVKPPLGYFTVITSAFGSFASGSSSISLLPDASSTAAWTPIFSPLDDGLAACVGLLGGFWLLRRLKHIQP
jgi:hypothetical protein